VLAHSTSAATGESADVTPPRFVLRIQAAPREIHCGFKESRRWASGAAQRPRFRGLPASQVGLSSGVPKDEVITRHPPEIVALRNRSEWRR
jgi:hypothetical protein